MYVTDKWLQQAVKNLEARLLRYTKRFVPEMHAREIVQEAFLRLWKENAKSSTDLITLTEQMTPWLFTVCRNQALDWNRRESVRRKFELEVIETEVPVNPEQKLFAFRRRQTLTSLIEKLPKDQQEVLRLKFEEDLSYKEISGITGHSLSYVGVLIHSAMTELRRQTEEKS